MFENLDNYLAGVETKIDNITEQQQVTHNRLCAVHSKVNTQGSGSFLLAVFNTFLLLVLTLAFLTMKVKVAPAPAPAPAPVPCCTQPDGGCPCHLSLLDSIPRAEELKLLEDADFTDKMFAAAKDAIAKPRIVKINKNAVAKGNTFSVQFGGGIGHVEISSYEVNPQKGTDIVQYRGESDGKEFFEIFIDHDCISGYFDIDMPGAIVRVETIKSGYAILFPVAKKKVVID